ncbi:MAG: hypothetical protein Q4G30_07855 [Actinomycetaceae bacterium]|nr:hypothetical protein [Actinomycetaceae bacterium]
MQFAGKDANDLRLWSARAADKALDAAELVADATVHMVEQARPKVEAALENAVATSRSTAQVAREVVAPKLIAYRDATIPKIEAAWDAAVPRFEAAIDAAGPKIEAAKEKIVDDYAVRAQTAIKSATDAAHSKGSLTEKATKAGDAAMSALKTPTRKKRCPLPAPWLWTALAAVVAVVGIIAWRRAQPIDDPWAEEAWEDVDEDLVVILDPSEEDSAK